MMFCVFRVRLKVYVCLPECGFDLADKSKAEVKDGNNPELQDFRRHRLLMPRPDLGPTNHSA